MRRLTAAPVSESTVTSRLAALKDALKGLVTDGTLTRAQADKVAATLEEELPARGHGGSGGRGGAVLDAAATAIGVTVEELRAALGEGRTLARVAEAERLEGILVDLGAPQLRQVQRASC